MANPLFFEHLSVRSGKPRETGITMVRDDGHPLPELVNLLGTYGHLIDYVKFRQCLTWYLDFDELLAKIRACTDADVRTFCGGTVLEAAHLHRRTEYTLDIMKEMGLTAVEVSHSMVPLDTEQLAHVVKLASSRGFEVLYEYGKKFQKSSFDVDEATHDIKDLLDAGAHRIIVERWQLDAALGPTGDAPTAHRVVELAERVGLRHLVFEAEAVEHQVWLINALGPEVNLGPNIQPFNVPSKLEPYRNGLGSEIGYAIFPRMTAATGTVVEDLFR
jgi:phosphosulfolactate synthase